MSSFAARTLVTVRQQLGAVNLLGEICTKLKLVPVTIRRLTVKQEGFLARETVV